MCKFYNVYEVLEERKDTKGCEWLLLEHVNKNYYCHIGEIGNPKEIRFYDLITDLLDEALYMVLYVTNCAPRESVPGGICREIVSKEELENICTKFSKEYREHVQKHEIDLYMADEDETDESREWTDEEIYYYERWKEHKRKIEDGIMFTDEFWRRVIEKTIEFDKKIHDPEFLEKVRLEEEEIMNMDFDQYFKDAETE